MFIIGIDPHKGSHTAAAVVRDKVVIDTIRVNADRDQRARLLAWAAQFEPRSWAVEGATGMGALLAQQLVAAGEHVVDVPPKLSLGIDLVQSDHCVDHLRHPLPTTTGLPHRPTRHDRDHDRRDIRPITNQVGTKQLRCRHAHTSSKLERVRFPPSHRRRVRRLREHVPAQRQLGLTARTERHPHTMHRRRRPARQGPDCAVVRRSGSGYRAALRGALRRQLGRPRRTCGASAYRILCALSAGSHPQRSVAAGQFLGVIRRLEPRRAACG